MAVGPNTCCLIFLLGWLGNGNTQEDTGTSEPDLNYMTDPFATGNSELSGGIRDSVEHGMSMESNHYESFEVIDDIMASSNVTTFLASLPTDMHRTLVRDQLRNCPYLPLCNFSLGLSEPMYPYESCCIPCSCDSDCWKDMTCCPDAIPAETLESFVRDVASSGGNFHCFPGYVSDTTRRTLFGIAHCPPDADKVLSSRCSEEYTNTSALALEDIVPVYDVRKDTSYRNIWCATCHDVEVNHLRFYSLELACLMPVSPEFYLGKPESQLLSAVLNQTLPCDLKFSDPAMTICYPGISTCNETGSWETYDLSEHVGCLAYESSIHISTDYHYLWRNIHCAKCNGVQPQETACQLINQGQSAHYPFSSLLNFRSRKGKFGSEKTDEYCGAETSLYDNHTDSCIEFSCSPLRRPSNGQCVPRYMYERPPGLYEITSQLRPHNTMSMEQALQLADGSLWFQTDRKILGHLNINAFLCDRSLVLFSDLTTSVSVKSFDMTKVALSQIYLTVRLDLAFDHYPETLFEEVLALENETFILTRNGRQLVFDWAYVDSYRLKLGEPAPINVNAALNLTNSSVFSERFITLEPIQDHARLVVRFQTDKNDIGCPPYEEVTGVWELRTCPLINVSLQDIDWTLADDGIRIENNGALLPVQDFGFVGDTMGMIVVCANEYFKFGLNKITANKKGDDRASRLDAETILSLVCISLSILGCLLTLATYFYLPSLRSLPGKNLMSLTAALLIAQISYLFGSFMGFKPKSILCQTFGVLTHWAWLLTFLWMNICTFHTFRVLAKTRPIRSETGWKRFVSYHMYCFISATVIVSINIAVSSVTGPSETVGYGTVICYIDSPLMVGLTFALPLGIILLANVAMFLIVVVHVRRAAEVQKSVKNERNDFSIFVKLSTLTGLTWSVGFVHAATEFAPLSYVFILLNGSQGLFLFVSFVLNRRVYRILQKKSGGETSNQTTNTTSTRM